jgi:hypothetical protein
MITCRKKRFDVEDQSLSLKALLRRVKIARILTLKVSI